jgi:hypothetical protein
MPRAAVAHISVNHCDFHDVSPLQLYYFDCFATALAP